MAINVAEHVRIFEVDPSDEFVAKREAVIKDLRGQYQKSTTVEALLAVSESLMSPLTGATSSDAEETRVAAAITKQSRSFVKEGRSLEIAVCGLLAIADFVGSSANANERLATADVYAISLWSALSFLAPLNKAKLEKLRLELIAIARNRIERAGLEMRARRTVPPFAEFGDSKIEATIFQSATRTTIDALRFNAALDREEIDILWWAMASASTIMEKPMSELSPQLGAVIAGFEVGTHLRTLPTSSHRNVATRGIPDGAKISLQDLLSSVDGTISPLRSEIESETTITSSPSTFPLLHGILKGTTGSVNEAETRTLREWAGRALLESSLLRLQYPESSRK